MPSDDLVLNVRQIASYPIVSSALASDAVLLQRGGLGGPYNFIDAMDLVATALAQGGTLQAGQVSASSVNTQSLTTGHLTATASANFSTLMGLDADFGSLTIGGARVATTAYVDSVTGAITARMVTTFMGRTGDILLGLSDIIFAGGAPIGSPHFWGCPTAPTPSPGDSSYAIATTQFVQMAIAAAINSALLQAQLVASFNGRTGAVTLTSGDITGAGGALLVSPAFTGAPTAPTPLAGSNGTQIATTAWVVNEVGGILGAGFAPINSPNFSGVPTAPTATAGSSDGQIATTAFVHNAVVAATTGVSSFNTRTGAVVLLGADIASAGGALLASPVFSGVPSAPTALPGTSTTQIATTAFVAAVIANGLVATFNGRSGAVTLTAADVTGAGGAPIASPGFTGVPVAPTATVGTSTTQIATTAFVAAAIAAAPIGVATFNGRTGAVLLLANDISGAGGALLAGPAFTGVPSAPTAVAGTNTTQLATCAFVMTQLASSGVSSFNTRTGAVVLQAADVTGAGGALLASPSFSGAPTAPTAAPGTSTLQLATTAFVGAAVAGAVVSFNTRTGNVTLLAADITSAGGALLASPSFSGVPLAPTAAPGTNTQQLASTAYVLAAITSGAVQSFNSRTGAVTLQANDISAAGGALLLSPALTGTPTAPTPGASSNSTAIATTAFVVSALAGAGGVTSWNSRAGAVTMTNADVIGVLPSSSAIPLMNGTAAAGSSTAWSRGDHVHPTDTSRAAASALASYLPLTGGTLTGALNAVGTVNVQAVGAGNAQFGVLNNAGSPMGYFYWNAPDSSIRMFHVASGGIAYLDGAGNFVSSGSMLPISFGMRPGSAGGISAQHFNLYWTGTACQFWVDNVNAGNFTLTSDYRSKKNVKPLGSMWERLKKLKPISYTHRDFSIVKADDKERWGFAAHELQEALIEDAASGKKDAKDVIQSPNLMTVLATLTKALQEAMQRIEALEAKAA